MYGYNFQIGLMRNGKLLAEASPSEILEKYQTESLEEAFLRLSEMEVQHRSQSVNQTPVSVTEINNILTLDSIYTGYPKNVGTYLFRVLSICLFILTYQQDGPSSLINYTFTILIFQFVGFVSIPAGSWVNRVIECSVCNKVKGDLEYLHKKKDIQKLRCHHL